jgi:hypothetical protein
MELARPRAVGDFFGPRAGRLQIGRFHIVTLRMWLRFERAPMYSLRRAPHNVESSLHAPGVKRFCTRSGNVQLRMTAGG